MMTFDEKTGRVTFKIGIGHTLTLALSPENAKEFVSWFLNGKAGYEIKYPYSRAPSIEKEGDWFKLNNLPNEAFTLKLGFSDVAELHDAPHGTIWELAKTTSKAE